MPVKSEHRAASYIYQSYITWAEWAGAGVVLIPYDCKNLDEYFAMVDGFVWVGGGIENMKTHSPTQYTKLMRVYKRAYEYAVRQNKKRSFPIFGICLGFYLLVMLGEGVEEHMFRRLEKVEKFGEGPLTFEGVSEIRGLFTVEEQRKLARGRVTNHMHHLGFLESSAFVRGWKKVRVVSVEDEFVNMIEFKDYPFYGCQWHPDRPLSALAEKVSLRLIEFVTAKCETHTTWGNLRRMGTSILIL